MACFIVPAAGAVVCGIVANRLSRKKSSGKESDRRIPFYRKLSWLTNLLLGGSALLAFEHVWHGEVTPWPPFLTAAGTDAAAMLHEMATVGVAMLLLVTAVWGIMVAVSARLEKRALTSDAEV